MTIRQPIDQRRFILFACIAIATSALIAPGRVQSREWVSANGNNTIEADFVRVDGDNVTLRMADGSLRTVKPQVFSKQDREFIAQQEAKSVSDSPQQPDRFGTESATPAQTSPEVAMPKRVMADHTTPSEPTADSDRISRDAPVSSSGADMVEIVYNGRTIRVPVEDINKAAIDLVGQELSIKIKPQVVAAQQSDAATATGGQDVPRPVQTAEVPSDDAVVAPTQNPATAPASTPMLAAVILLTVGVLGLLSYFLVIEPLRRQRPLRKAVKIIRDEQRPLYQEAEDLLNQALLGGLRKKNISVARFSLAHLRSLLGQYEEAATVLADLEKSGAKIDRPTAYLMLWVQSKVGNHERVDRIYNGYQKQLKGYKQSELIVSISYLGLAFLRLSRREIGGALHYFEQVRQLNVLADEIPSHLDDYEVVSGVVALFEKNVEEAVKHFQAAVDSATERSKPTYAGRLGLLLCQWRSEQLPDIDRALADVLSEIKPDQDIAEDRPIRTNCPHCDQQYSLTSRYVGKKVQCKKAECKRRFVVSATIETSDSEEQQEDVSDDRLFSESDLLLRNSLLWYSVSLLVVWLRRPEKSGMPAADQLSIRQRLKEVKDLDPDCGDAFLLGGLIDYYFAETDDDRASARVQIEKAVDLEVHVPEVIQLLDRMNKLAALAEHSLSYFHQLSNQYATNAEVDPQLRTRFVRTMKRYSQFREMGEIDALDSEESMAPSLENLQGRGQILRNRVSNIVHYNLDKEESDVRDEIVGRLDDLDEQSQSLAKGAKAFQETELQLMESTGEFLFNDDEVGESDEE